MTLGIFLAGKDRTGVLAALLLKVWSPPVGLKCIAQ